MQVDRTTEVVPKQELGDYIDIIKHRLESIDQPLLKQKYSPSSLIECRSKVEGQLRVLDMHHKNNFAMYRNVFDDIKLIISNSFRLLKA